MGGVISSLFGGAKPAPQVASIDTLKAQRDADAAKAAEQERAKAQQRKGLSGLLNPDTGFLGVTGKSDKLGNA